MKIKRIVDLKLLEAVRLLPCSVCGIRYDVIHAHHVKSRKSGGPDIEKNVMSLCVKHHVEVHQFGVYTMSMKYPLFKRWLVLRGWELEGNRWRNHEVNSADEAERL